MGLTDFKRRYYCNTCGRELTNETARRKLDSEDEPVANCRECENKYFSKLESKNGAHMALFACCMAFNVPFIPSDIPSKEELAQAEGSKWELYLDILNNRKDEKRKKVSFFGGVTNMLHVFGKNLTETDVARYVAWEKSQMRQLPGTEEQRSFWGSEWESDDDYNDLDSMLGNFLDSFGASITITTQAQDTLVRVCKLRHFGDKRLQKGDVKNASEAYRTADSLLSSDCLREKDKKPMEEVRPDSLVSYFESLGIMKEADLVSVDEIQRIFAEKFFGREKYKYSIDAADQMILAMINTERQNDGEPLLTGLTSDLATVDYWGEFSPEETEAEKEAKRFAGLTKVEIKK